MDLRSSEQTLYRITLAMLIPDTLLSTVVVYYRVRVLCDKVCSFCVSEYSVTQYAPFVSHSNLYSIGPSWDWNSTGLGLGLGLSCTICNRIFSLRPTS